MLFAVDPTGIRRPWRRTLLKPHGSLHQLVSTTSLGGNDVELAIYEQVEP